MIFTASKEDLPKVFEMAKKVQEEQNFENFHEPNYEKAFNFLYNSWLKYPIFVYKDKESNEIVGMVGIIVEAEWWTDDKIVLDYVFYVEPKHRKTEVAGALIEAVKDFAKINDLKVVIQFVTSDHIDKKLELFEKHDFRKSGFVASFGM